MATALTINGVSVYALHGGKTLPQWVSEKKRKALNSVANLMLNDFASADARNARSRVSERAIASVSLMASIRPDSAARRREQARAVAAQRRRADSAESAAGPDAAPARRVSSAARPPQPALDLSDPQRLHREMQRQEQLPTRGSDLGDADALLRNALASKRLVRRNSLSAKVIQNVYTKRQQDLQRAGQLPAEAQAPTGIATSPIKAAPGTAASSAAAGEAPSASAGSKAAPRPFSLAGLNHTGGDSDLALPKNADIQTIAAVAAEAATRLNEAVASGRKPSTPGGSGSASPRPGSATARSAQRVSAASLAAGQLRTQIQEEAKGRRLLVSGPRDLSMPSTTTAKHLGSTRVSLDNAALHFAYPGNLLLDPRSALPQAQNRLYKVKLTLQKAEDTLAGLSPSRQPSRAAERGSPSTRGGVSGAATSSLPQRSPAAVTASGSGLTSPPSASPGLTIHAVRDAHATPQQLQTVSQSQRVDSPASPVKLVLVKGEGAQLLPTLFPFESPAPNKSSDSLFFGTANGATHTHIPGFSNSKFSPERTKALMSTNKADLGTVYVPAMGNDVRATAAKLENDVAFMLSQASTVAGTTISSIRDAMRVIESIKSDPARDEDSDPDDKLGSKDPLFQSKPRKNVAARADDLFNGRGVFMDAVKLTGLGNPRVRRINLEAPAAYSTVEKGATVAGVEMQLEERYAGSRLQVIYDPGAPSQEVREDMIYRILKDFLSKFPFARLWNVSSELLPKRESVHDILKTLSRSNASNESKPSRPVLARAQSAKWKILSDGIKEKQIDYEDLELQKVAEKREQGAHKEVDRYVANIAMKKALRDTNKIVSSELVIKLCAALVKLSYWLILRPRYDGTYTPPAPTALSSTGGLDETAGKKLEGNIKPPTRGEIDSWITAVLLKYIDIERALLPHSENIARIRPVILLSIRVTVDAYLRTMYGFHFLLEATIAGYLRKFVPKTDLSGLAHTMGNLVVRSDASTGATHSRTRQKDKLRSPRTEQSEGSLLKGPKRTNPSTMASATAGGGMMLVVPLTTDPTTPDEVEVVPPPTEKIVSAGAESARRWRAGSKVSLDESSTMDAAAMDATGNIHALDQANNPDDPMEHTDARPQSTSGRRSSNGSANSSQSSGSYRMHSGGRRNNPGRRSSVALLQQTAEAVANARVNDTEIAIDRTLITRLAGWVPTHTLLDSLTAALLDPSRFGSHLASLETRTPAMRIMEKARRELRRAILVGNIAGGTTAKRLRANANVCHERSAFAPEEEEFFSGSDEGSVSPRNRRVPGSTTDADETGQARVANSVSEALGILLHNDGLVDGAADGSAILSNGESDGGLSNAYPGRNRSRSRGRASSKADKATLRMLRQLEKLNRSYLPRELPSKFDSLGINASIMGVASQHSSIELAHTRLRTDGLLNIPRVSMTAGERNFDASQGSQVRQGGSLPIVGYPKTRADFASMTSGPLRAIFDGATSPDARKVLGDGPPTIPSMSEAALLEIQQLAANANANAKPKNSPSVTKGAGAIGSILRQGAEGTASLYPGQGSVAFSSDQIKVPSLLSVSNAQAKIDIHKSLVDKIKHRYATVDAFKFDAAREEAWAETEPLQTSSMSSERRPSIADLEQRLAQARGLQGKVPASKQISTELLDMLRKGKQISQLLKDTLLTSQEGTLALIQAEELLKSAMDATGEQNASDTSKLTPTELAERKERLAAEHLRKAGEKIDQFLDGLHTRNSSVPSLWISTHGRAGTADIEHDFISTPLPDTEELEAEDKLWRARVNKLTEAVDHLIRSRAEEATAVSLLKTERGPSHHFQTFLLGEELKSQSVHSSDWDGPGVIMRRSSDDQSVCSSGSSSSGYDETSLHRITLGDDGDGWHLESILEALPSARAGRTIGGPVTATGGSSYGLGPSLKSDSSPTKPQKRKSVRMSLDLTALGGSANIDREAQRRRSSRMSQVSTVDSIRWASGTPEDASSSASTSHGPPSTAQTEWRAPLQPLGKITLMTPLTREALGLPPKKTTEKPEAHRASMVHRKSTASKMSATNSFFTSPLSPTASSSAMT